MSQTELNLKPLELKKTPSHSDSFIQNLVDIGRLESDDNIRVNAKRILVALAFLMSGGGILWGSICLYFGFYLPMAIPYGYVVGSFLNMLFFAQKKNFRAARFIQLFMSLLLPFGFQWSLGGFAVTGTVMLWATLALIGTIILYQGVITYLWLLFFIGLTIFSYYIDPYVEIYRPEILNQGTSQVLLVMNISVIFSILFFLAKLKVDEDTRIRRRLDKANQDLQELSEEQQTQNEELQQLSEETSTQRDYIQEKNLELAGQNKKILKSIQVGDRIQRAVLPDSSRLKEYFSDYFMLYQPLDIVSGDFYWAKKTEDGVLLAVIDCTGHGVPGAFMSLIVSLLLTEVSLKDGLSSPAKILDYLYSEIPKRLKQSQTKGKEGLDIALCKFRKPENSHQEVVFAGAKRPLVYSKQGKLIELKGDSQHIGGNLEKKPQPFTEHRLNLPLGTLIYLFTDGFGDIPNPSRKKYGKKRLLATLESIHTQPLEQQKQRLIQEAKEYQSFTESRDDITVMGIKL